MAKLTISAGDARTDLSQHVGAEAHGPQGEPRTRHAALDIAACQGTQRAPVGAKPGLRGKECVHV